MSDTELDKIEITQEDERDPEILKQLAQLDPESVTDNNKEEQKKDQKEIPQMANTVQTTAKESNQMQQIIDANTESITNMKKETTEVTSLAHFQEPTDTQMKDALPSLEKSSLQKPSAQPLKSGTLKIIRDRIDAYNKYALKYQRSGDQLTAAKYLNVISRLRTLEEKVIAGEAIDPQKVPPPPALLATPSPKRSPPVMLEGTAATLKPPQRSEMLSSTASTKVITPPKQNPSSSKSSHTLIATHVATENEPNAEENIDISQLPPDSDVLDDVEEEVVPPNRDKTFEMIETYLKRQIVAAHKNALKAKQEGKREEALKYLREKKRMMNDLAQVTEAKKRPNIPPPEYRIEVLKKQEVVSNSDLAMEHLEFNIIRCIDVRLPRGYTSLSLYVYSVFQYPPSSAIKLRTPTVKGDVSHQFNYKMKVWIDRKPSFLRFVKAKKIVFEVYHQRGFLWRDLLIGRAEWKPEALLRQCTVHAIVDIVEGRKNVVGKLEFEVRIREPLMGRQIKLTEEKYLIVTKHFSLTDESSVNTPPSSVPHSAKKPQAPNAIPSVNTETESVDNVNITATNNTNNTNNTATRDVSSGSLNSPVVNNEQKPQQSNNIEASLTVSEMYQQLPVKEDVSLTNTSDQPAVNSLIISSALSSSHSMDNTLVPSTIEKTTERSDSVSAVSSPLKNDKAKRPLPAPSASKKQPKVTKITHERQSQEESDEDLTSVDRMKSHAVLEYEKRKIEKEIEKLKQANRKIPEELSDRLSQVQLKLNLLMLQIETGQLTPEIYAQMLKREINTEKALAEKLKKQGKVDLAEEALRRAKIMEDELQS